MIQLAQYIAGNVPAYIPPRQYIKEVCAPDRMLSVDSRTELKSGSLAYKVYIVMPDRPVTVQDDFCPGIDRTQLGKCLFNLWMKNMVVRTKNQDDVYEYVKA
jgi:hypothetical protein